MDVLLWLSGALGAGPIVLDHPGWALAAALGAATVARWRRPGRGPVSMTARIGVGAALAAAVAVGAVRSLAVERAFSKEMTRVDAMMSGVVRCSGVARVVGMPTKRGGVLRWTADLDALQCGHGRERGPPPRVALYGGPAAVARGDTLAVTMQLAPLERFWNFDTPNPRWSAAKRGVTRSGAVLDATSISFGRWPAAWIDRARHSVRERIEATFSQDAAPMARALVLGEEDLTLSDSEAFRVSGLAHLLAVSGMHLVLVVLGLAALLRGLLVRCYALAARVDVGRVSAVFAIGVAWLYADFAGASGSAIRAAAMLTVGMFARACGRRSGATRAFGLSSVVLVLADPLIGLDVSFLLSVAATFGLVYLARPIETAIASVSRHCPRWLARSMAATASASLACAPVLVTFAPTLPAGGLLANLVAAPVGELAALPLCLVHALLAFWPLAERGCALAAGGALVLVRGVARISTSIPWLAVALPPPTPGQLAALFVGCVAAWHRHGKERLAVGLATCAVLLVLEKQARVDSAPPRILRATFLDVGQGDATLIDLPGGGAMLVDGGGIVGSSVDVGTRVLAPMLRSRRRSSLDVVVLSHPHPDHFGGLATGLTRARFSELWDTGQGEAEGTAGAYATLLERARHDGARVLRPSALCGSHTLGGVQIEVLAPCPSYTSDDGPNDNSLVMRVSFGARALLFVGDAEAGEEGRLLLTARDRLRADVLKVGHHGSKTSSTPSFIAAVGPEHAVVSVGTRNRFGHPAPATLATLANAGAKVWRTDRDGAVCVTTDGRALVVTRAASAE